MSGENLIFSDPEMAEEFLDRFDELVEVTEEGAGNEGVTVGGGRGLEGMGRLEVMKSLPFTKDDARTAVRLMQESRTDDVKPGLEAIIRRYGRPAFFVQSNTFETDSAPSSSKKVNEVVNDSRTVIEQAIPSVGRINLENHRMPWVGTGWVVAPNVVVTNRHVASEFAQRDGNAFVFIETSGRQAKAKLDTVREHNSGQEKVFRLKDVLWIAPPTGSHDVAFLSIAPESENDDPQPPQIELMDQASFDNFEVKKWATVIGYPAFSIFNNAQDQQRIFDGTFDVKRMQPGKIMNKGLDGIVNHDATTLGGNSGSVVLDLDSGRAIALHFGGIEGATNSAVAAPVVFQLLHTHVLNTA